MIKIFYAIVSYIPVNVWASSVEAVSEPIISVQWILNAAFTLICILGGWLISLIHESIRDLQKNNIEITGKIHGIELSVTGQYVRKEDLDKLFDGIFIKLDKIDQRLDKISYRDQ